MTTKRVRDFVLYICIALGFGFLCIWFAEYDVDSKWLAVVFETCLVFGFVIAQQRQSWKSPAFWIVLLVVFAIHSVVAILLVRQMSKLRAAWVGAAFIIEAVAFTSLLEAAAVSRTLTPKAFRNRH